MLRRVFWVGNTYVFLTFVCRVGSAVGLASVAKTRVAAQVSQLSCSAL